MKVYGLILSKCFSLIDSQIDEKQLLEIVNSTKSDSEHGQKMAVKIKHYDKDINKTGHFHFWPDFKKLEEFFFIDFLKSNKHKSFRP